MSLLLPLRRLEIRSVLAPQDFERRLSTVTQPRWSWLVWPAPPIQFIGRVSTGVFRVLLVEPGRNTYAAWILGRVESPDGGSRISARVTLHPVAIVAVLGFLVVSQVSSIVRGQGIDVIPALLLIGFHVGMYYLGFLPAARRAERTLRTLAA